MREQAKANVEQLLAGHQNALQEMKETHEADLESQVKTLEKRIANQSLELRATQEDLTKAKTAAAAAQGHRIERMREGAGLIPLTE